MAFTMSVAGETLAELKANLLAAGHSIAAVTSSPPAEASKAKSKPAPEPEEDEAPAPKPKAAAKKPPPPPEPEEDEEPALDFAKDIRPHLIALGETHGRDEAVKVCGQFEDANGDACTKGQQVQPKDWPAFLEAVKKAKRRLDRAKADAEDE